MKVLLRGLYKLAGIVMILLGLFLIVMSWTAYAGTWPNIGFLQDTWTWSAVLTLVGGFIVAIGVVFVRV